MSSEAEKIAQYKRWCARQPEGAPTRTYEEWDAAMTAMVQRVFDLAALAEEALHGADPLGFERACYGLDQPAAVWNPPPAVRLTSEPVETLRVEQWQEPLPWTVELHEIGRGIHRTWAVQAHHPTGAWYRAARWYVGHTWDSLAAGRDAAEHTARGLSERREGKRWVVVLAGGERAPSDGCWRAAAVRTPMTTGAALA